MYLLDLTGNQITLVRTYTTGEDPTTSKILGTNITPLNNPGGVTIRNVGSILDNTNLTQSTGGSGYTIGVATKNQTQGLFTQGQGSGLIADISATSSISINTLREAFAIQRFLERSARSGSRYIETIEGHFNVKSPDARLQRPEYLGGKRIPINISQVVQMSGTESSSGTQQTAQGNVAAYSLTADKSGSFTKSFTEHGMIIGLMCVRTEHTYQQGINKMFSKKRIYEFYWPEFSHLSEVPILRKEIFATGSSNNDDATFGFNEVYYEYRYKPSMVAGEMRSKATNSLDVYHFADDYASAPSLGQSWIQETHTNIDRTLAVTSAVSNQFIADIYFSLRCARPMPTYSVPGLIDHF